MTVHDINIPQERVYILDHEYKGYADQIERKSIGVYSSVMKAQAAIIRLRNMPGFVEYPDGFIIRKWKIDEDSWINGFVRHQSRSSCEFYEEQRDERRDNLSYDDRDIDISVVIMLYYEYEEAPSPDYLHVYQDEVKFIGAYSRKEMAEAAIDRLKYKNGFIDHPDCFRMYERTLNIDSWCEGFV